MIIKIGNKFHDSNQEPFLVILSEKEKQDIRRMGTAKRYCSYPDSGFTMKDIVDFMSDDPPERMV